MAELEELESRLAEVEAERWVLLARNEDLLAEIRQLNEKDAARPGYHAPELAHIGADYQKNLERVRVLDQGLHSLRLEVAGARLAANPEQLEDLRQKERQAYDQVVGAVRLLADVQKQLVRLGALPHCHVSLGVANY